jgi:hypothetical protein
VAGRAAALFSRYPGLTNRQVRDIIERTADKVGHDRWSLFDSDGNFIRVVTSPAHYADEPNFFNGTRNRGMGYGRINMYRALDFADVFIKDWPGDKGDEPSAPPGGAFWLSSDMVVRSEDDGVFAAPESLMSSFIWRGQDNFLYVRMTNNGPNIARGLDR